MAKKKKANQAQNRLRPAVQALPLSQKLAVLVPMLVALAVAVAVLAIPLGVSDGGANYSTLERYGMYYTSAPSADFFQTQFGMHSDGAGALDSSFGLLLAMVKSFMTDDFDVRGLGAVLSILLLLGLWLLMKGGRCRAYGWTNILLNVLAVLMFADLGYVMLFNTISPKGWSMVLMLLLAGTFLLAHGKKEAGPGAVIGAAVLAALFATAGTVQAVIGVVLGILIIRLFPLCKKNWVKVMAAVLGTVVLVGSVGFAAAYRSPDYKKDLYNTVFNGIAQKGDITELGLDAGLQELAGQYYSELNAYEYGLDQNFYAKVNYGTVARYYLTHPAALGDVLGSAARNGFTLRTPYLGNFTGGEPVAQANGFNLYSAIKGKFAPAQPLLFVLFMCAYFGILFYLFVREKEKRHWLELFLALGVMALIAFVMPPVISGKAEINMTLFLFNVLYDLMLLVILVGGIRVILERQQQVKDRFGVTQ